MDNEVDLLTRALQRAEVKLPNREAVIKMAEAVSWAVTSRRVYEQSESCALADDVESWLNSVEQLCSDLSDKLAKPPGNAGFHLTRYAAPATSAAGWPMSLFDLRLILIAVEQSSAQARAYLEEQELLGRPIIRKSKGMSPTDRYIADMAKIFQEFVGALPKVQRLNSANDLGGHFVDFVQFVSKECGDKPPGAEAIKKALRKAPLSR